MDKYLKWTRINNLPPIIISSGTMEAVKWIALVSMTVDHINQFFFDTRLYSAYCFGRLAMPLFAFIFAYNLAQPDAYSRGLYNKVLTRLIFFGLIATPAYIAMRHLQDLWPLNILFTLALATAALLLYEEGGFSGYMIGLAIFLIGGPFVEYNWIGVFFCITSWFYCKKPSLVSLIGCLVAYLLLGGLNGNNWALLSLVIIILATQINVKLPRIPHFFYYYYAIHLWALYLLSIKTN